MLARCQAAQDQGHDPARRVDERSHVHVEFKNGLSSRACAADHNERPKLSPCAQRAAAALKASYCAAAAGVDATLHHLRHTPASELVDDGVSLVTIRKRRGHKNLQTTLRWAEQTDATADAARSWLRKTTRRLTRGRWRGAPSSRTTGDRESRPATAQDHTRPPPVARRAGGYRGACSKNARRSALNCAGRSSIGTWPVSR